jgi:N-acetylglutamate synthase-like GNAT family acetyltransferase
MEPRTFTLGPATCRIRRCNKLSEHMVKHTRELCDLYVPPAERRKGHATALVREVLKQADAAGLVLLVRPPSDVQDWFGRFGFMKIQDAPLLLARNAGRDGPKPERASALVMAGVHQLFSEAAKQAKQARGI